MAPAKKKQGKGAPPVPASKVRKPAAKKKPTTPSFANITKASMKRADNIVARKAAKELERARRRDEWRAMQAESQKTSRSSIYDYVKDWPRKEFAIGNKTEPFMLKKWIAGTIGAPSVKYTAELGLVLEDLVVHGISLDCISTLQGLPGLSVIAGWIADSAHPFSSGYLRAKLRMVPFLEEQALAVAREPMTGEVRVTRSDSQLGDSTEVRESDNVQRATLLFNAYQWTLTHLVPKKHGRLPDQGAGAGTEQLEALFQALKSGPVK